MKFSEKVDHILPAIQAVQANLVPPVKSKEVEVAMKSGGKYKFSYADLRAVMGSVEGLIKENGLFLIQGTGVEMPSQMYGLFTRVIHLKSGQWVETFSEIDRKCTANEQGGEQTTFRRHQVTNLFAIVPIDEAATEKPAPRTVGAVRATAAPRPAVQARGPAPAQNGGFNDYNETAPPFPPRTRG